MTDSRTEQDLVAALDLLGSNAPEAAAVLPAVSDAAGIASTHRRLFTGRALPLVAALAVIGIAVGIAFATSSSEPSTTSNSPATPNSVVGVWWQLERINGQRLGPSYLSLDIDPHGNFQQSLGNCEGITGELTVQPDTLRLIQVRHEFGDCPAVLHPGTDDVSGLLRLLSHEVRWTVADSMLTLSGSGVTATYVPYPASETPSRQWTYNGVGISVPASWPRDAIRCGAPTTSTIIYPHAASECASAGDRTATSVELGPLTSTRDGQFPTNEASQIEIDGASATERFVRLKDGRQLAEVRIPSHNARVTIISPDPAFAVHLAEFEIYIVDQ